MRRTRTARRAALVAGAALCALATLGAQPASASPSAAPCSAGQLAGKVRQASGAAGTAAVSIAIRNISPASCALRGFPKLKLRNAAGPLPTHVLHGGLAILEEPVTTVTLAPGHRASLLVAYSNIPTGSQTSCPHATRLVIILRHGQGRFSIAFTGAPCNGGLLRESPFLAGLHGV
jgi:uncharacterized protein DUF4232